MPHFLTHVNFADSSRFQLLRQLNLLLLAALPAALLLSRGAAEIVIVVIDVSFIAVVIAQRQWHVLRPPLIVALLLTWAALVLIVSPLAMDPHASLTRSLPWLRFIVFFAAVTSWLVPTRAELKLICIAWTATLLMAITDGLVQLATGVSASGQPIDGTRLTGPLSRPNIGSFVARIGFPVMAGWVLLASLQPPGKHLLRQNLLVLVLGLFLAVFIFLTGERAASLLTAAAVILVILLIAILRPGYLIISLSGIGLFLICGAAVLLISDRIMNRARSVIDTLANLWDSIYGQLLMTGLQMWLDNPITGVGLKGFRAGCDHYLAQGIISECHPHPHNIYVEWLAESGLIGSLGFFAFILLLCWADLRLLRPRALPVTGALLTGCLLIALFPFSVGQSFFSNWPAILFWSSLGLSAAIMRIALNDEKGQHR
jgi:O-antigen ligase